MTDYSPSSPSTAPAAPAAAPIVTEDVKMTSKNGQDLEIPPCRVLGVFGMSLYTKRDDLEKLFQEYGKVERVNIVMDRHTGRSRGYGFVYFENLEEAEIARLKTNGLELNERTIRVDFSRTEAPHNPTPGFYNGKSTLEHPRRPYDDRSDRSSRHTSSSSNSYRPSSRYGSAAAPSYDRHYVPSRRSNRSPSRSPDRNHRDRYRSRSPRRHAAYTRRSRSRSRSRSRNY